MDATTPQRSAVMLERLEDQVAELDVAVRQEAERRPEVRLLMTHPGVGPVVGLAYVLTIGPYSRFPRGRQVASYGPGRFGWIVANTSGKTKFKNRTL